MIPASARVSAPGKIILFGEHAVVYGQPAIAAPLAAVRTVAEARPAAAGAGLVIHAHDVGQRLRVTWDAAAEAPWFDALIYPAQLALRALDAPIPDLTLDVRSTIPIAGGLGSGAALATAIIRALGQALGRPFAREPLNALVYEVEKRHHGTPSGIDNTVIVYEQPVYFVRGTAPQPFTIGAPFTLLVADSGQPSPTRETVGDVRKLYEAAPERIGAVFERIGQIARDARAAIESGEVAALGALMNANQQALRQLSVSSPVLERLCAAAREAGASGAKLSGGGRGSNIIALVAPERAEAVRRALQAAGAVHVIQTVIAPPTP